MHGFPPLIGRSIRSIRVSCENPEIPPRATPIPMVRDALGLPDFRCSPTSFFSAKTPQHDTAVSSRVFPEETPRRMKRIPAYLKIRVLGALEYAEGDSMKARYEAVAAMTFKDEDEDHHRFTWRTIQTW